MKQSLTRPGALVLLALLATACATTDVAPTQAPSQSTLPEHLTLGNPSGATTDPSQPTNYLLSKPQYALSYHRDQSKPDWVSWHLSSTWVGSAACSLPDQEVRKNDPRAQIQNLAYSNKLPRN